MKRKISAQKQSTQNSLGSVLPQIQINDRVAIFGGTGSGKSILAQVMFRSLPKEWWGIIIDTTDSVLEPSALTFFDPDNIPWGEAWKMRFVPDISVDLEDQINRLYDNIFNHGACWVWLDEANEVSTAHHTAIGLRRVLLQGRKAFIGHASCTPRPADITKSIVSQAQYLITFALVDFDDKVRAARYMGMTPDEFDQEMYSLGEYEYLLFDIAHRTLYAVPPIPKIIVDDILNPPPAEEVEIEKPESGAL